MSVFDCKIHNLKYHVHDVDSFSLGSFILQFILAGVLWLYFHPLFCVCPSEGIIDPEVE